MKKKLLLIALNLSIALFSFCQTFTEDFEGGTLPGNWTEINFDMLNPALEDDIAFLDTAWKVTTSTTFEGFAALSISWYLDANGNDDGPCDDWLILPKLLIEPNGSFHFDAKSATSSGNFPDDYQILISEGEPTVEDFMVNGSILQSFDDEGHVDFTTHTIDLSGYSGLEVHLAIRNVTPGDGYGLWIDNVVVDGTITNVDEIASNVASFSLLSNPVEDELQLDFELLKKEPIRVFISDITGKVVMNIEKGTLPPGAYIENIDVSDFDRGVYLVNLILDDLILTKKMIKN